ncbi:MAG: hypothetical protein KJ970_04750 [Candidatus Eisenbacteria bacterium]|uniref:Alpha-L-rhamnosidase six-hairpin glycosidase domain-containing protein n=1 Tax=Eiseniibacteriota bacterium TaxID=2212470 RepID=A0A948RTD9_UNCEI|nr:hypothetical protein [Candidatus Eisenbacteria bacterium]MBU1950493.1 hypothetical protein [Candidatus Eisenbacteria bacterium]MBU2690216.1 hypothetical protein [Candidatus Eisenbacteria bacterium]
MKTEIKTGNVGLDLLYPLIISFLEKDLLELSIDGKIVRGFRSPDAKSIWIRDHSDMLRGGRYFYPDMTSAVEHFAETQSASGRIFDYFTTYPEKPPSERENWTKYVRVPVEADVEYRFIKAAYLAWQAAGDDAWILRLLPRMELALQYVMSHPWYWDAMHRLVKRPYTIDTWDFAYTAGAHDWLQFQIDENTYWGIMHGDNSGYYEAFRIMSRLYSRFGQDEQAWFWEQAAVDLKRNLNKLCWNGRFYTHFCKLSVVSIPGVNEDFQLSLSNPMAVNRGVAAHEQAVSILEEYQSRRGRTGAFAEWFSIDPPFPAGIFGDDKLVEGAYVNGGIMPLVGGELARAAFEHGHEEYGVDILLRYSAMISEKNETYLWYFPDGRAATIETSTSPEAEPTDGWGSSAMLYALIEGLAGIEDMGRGFDKCRISPRWPAAGVHTADIKVAYGASGGGIGYRYRRHSNSIELSLQTERTNASFHLLLPAGMIGTAVKLNKNLIPFQNAAVETSPYVEFEAEIEGHNKVTVHFESDS